MVPSEVVGGLSKTGRVSVVHEYPTTVLIFRIHELGSMPTCFVFLFMNQSYG